MPTKQRRTPKIQRGLSMTPELYEAIRADADKLGKPWNEVAESALARVFLAGRDYANSREKLANTGADLVSLPE